MILYYLYLLITLDKCNNKVINNLTMTDNEPKWDYTTKEGNFAAGAAVVGGNLLVIIIYILYRTVPSVHHFIIGR